MDTKELIEFLYKFKIDEKKINKFTENKQIISKNKNIFLTQKQFKANQIFGDGLIFIQLNGFLPSTYLLKFIQNNSKTIKIKTQKQALNYTYSKSLAISTIEQMRLEQERYYIVEFNNNILGYAKFDKKQIKRLPIINLMNIGEYLKEN